MAGPWFPEEASSFRINLRDELWGWGSSKSGKLGDGSVGAVRYSPVPVGSVDPSLVTTTPPSPSLVTPAASVWSLALFGAIGVALAIAESLRRRRVGEC